MLRDESATLMQAWCGAVRGRQSDLETFCFSEEAGAAQLVLGAQEGSETQRQALVCVLGNRSKSRLCDSKATGM